MYCPTCLNDSLQINKSGIINIIINSKKLDNGRFLFNLVDQTEEQVFETFEDKAEDFFKWYSKFQNPSKIQRIQIISSNFNCTSGCPFKANMKKSVLGVLLPEEEVKEVILTLGEKYNLEVELLDDEDNTI